MNRQNLDLQNTAAEEQPKRHMACRQILQMDRLTLDLQATEQTCR
jgi:hypothetical protein